MEISIGEQLMKDLLSGPLTSHYIDNYKPSWLDGLELDRYYPPLRMAFEFQGDQHIRFSFSKHKSHEEFFDQWNHDAQKKAVLLKKKIGLVEYNTTELSPELFSRKLANALLEPVDLNISDKLLNNISRYQMGLEIHFKRELKELLISTKYYDFIRIPHVDRAVEQFFSLPNLTLTGSEKFCLCILTLLSRNNQVLLSLSQFTKLLPKLQLAEDLDSLIKKELISYHPNFELISLNDKVSVKCQRFISALFLYVQSLSNKGTSESQRN